MLLNIIRYIRGYLRIRVAGYSAERFLNACSHKGICLWGLRPVGGAYEMNITIKGFRQLKPIIRKTRTKVVIVRRFGLPFFLHKYRKRKLFFAGAFLCLVLICLLSKFIWNIDIKGNITRTDETLLEFLDSKDVKNGMRIKEVDCARIVKDIRKEYDDIIWVSASVKGTRLLIQIKENEDSIPMKEDTDQKEEAYDIVADKACVITDIVVRNGIVQVKKGDKVKEGDILVSGQVPVNNDAGETTGYQYHVSDADITGQTVTKYQDSCSLTYIEKQDMEIQKYECFAAIGEYRAAFGGIRNKYEDFEEESRQYQCRIFDNFYLPVYWGVRTVRPYKPIERKYTKKELQELLTGRFSRYCEDLEKKGVEILQNDVKIYTGSDTAEAKGTLTVEMPIGEKSPSKLIRIPENEDEQSGEVIDGNDGSSN